MTLAGDATNAFNANGLAARCSRFRAPSGSGFGRASSRHGRQRL